MSSPAVSKVSEKARGTKQTVSESNIVSDHTTSKTPRSLKSIQSPDMSHDHSVATTREIQLDNKRPETVKEKPSADVRMEEKSAVKGKKSGSKKESQIPKGGRLKKLAQENPHQYIIPLLDLYVYQGKMEYAQSVFDTCMKHGRFKDLEVYNILLQGWAERGNIGAVKKLFSLMTKSEVEPDINSFGSALECLGRTKPLDRELVERIIKDLEQAGMTLNDVMLKHNFRRDSREVVLAVIQAVQPEFVHPLPPKLPVCSLEVVKGMYSETTEISPKAVFQLISKDEMRSKLDLQWKTEEKECIRSVEEDPHPSQHVLEKRKILAEHKGMWWRALKKGLEQQKKKQSYKKTFGHMKEHVYPFMTILNDDDYVQLMLESLPKFAATSEGIGTLHLARELGSRVNQRYIIRKKRRSLVAEKTQKLYWEYIQGLMKENQGDRWTHREQWQHLLHHDQTGPSLEFDTHIWPSSVTLKVGNFMADILLREIQIDANISTGKQEQKLIPGLYHMYAYRSMKQVGFIKPHPLVIDLFQGAKDPDLPFDSNILPMVSPPLPWTSARFGGYPLSATKLMRCKEGSLQSQLILDKAETPELHPVLDSLNQLSSVPWIVNKKMLDIIIDIFKKEGSKELDIPLPSSVYPSPPPITSDATPEEIAKIHQERAAMRKSQAEMHSLRMDMLYKLSIANHFRDDIFWFPHNMDFRGRVYPCPPHFNHLGSDVTRSLLQFAQGQPLGEKGLDWLKIHLINLSGLKKRCSLAERLTYANEILPDILDSADQPFEGKKWWQQTDEPWQALACCMDIAEAVRSPDPEKYVSHLPIHQDGSCNGLQHYAALGRDIIGAQQVNLHPFPVPQDVYSGVAQMVEELREKDAQNGLKIAKTLKGSVHRKVVKQTVMTVVYGVTAFGGRHQIFRQLKDAEVLSENDAWYAAGYLVLKVFQSLGKMFAKTREIQDWLTESALMIAKGGSSVEWVTPLGLPIVQPYHKKNQVWVSTTEKWSLYHNDTTNAKGRPDAQKQKNAFPPNFIHSLDSTHMMLTSLHCQRSGVTFASVHDCFWTHPCSVDLMNEICREQFVMLHEQPILHNLAKNLVEKFGELEVGPGMRIKHGNPMEILKVKDYVEKVPETGEFDLKNVLESTYFFS
ncbi:mitochondrial RNA polymerase [Apostichopus japonicus]|uniref:DNA-directed RNA polymerase n=1 Tax=Stichopus japonicus TaxID=307972 RepID=A0A2G8JUK0_STIJA|nr:mitochondrial RNA polymerase [Apostichopus japonicus]